MSLLGNEFKKIEGEVETTLMGDTATQVHVLLTEGEAKGEALKLAAENDAHELMGKLRTLYESVYGKVALDLHDWHWQATALLNHIRNQKAAAPAPAATTTDGASEKVGQTPEVTGASSAPAGSALSEAARSRHMGHAPVNETDPTIKSAPEAGDPSFVRTAPDVTAAGAGGATSNIGSPAAKEPNLSPEK